MPRTSLRREHAFFTIGLLVGLIVFALFRFVTYIEPAHYHANFAVFINDDRDKFDGPGFYEATTACSSSGSSSAAHRAHMHDQVNNVVHVHEEAVTWGMFFENIGYSVGERHLATNTELFTESNDQLVRFMLNGEEVDNVANKTIESEDQLLVSVTSPGANIAREYAKVDDSAKVFNSKADPAACSGSTSAFELRLKNIYE